MAARTSVLTLWNCQQKGHNFKECISLQGTIFCYKFGRVNIITPNCSKCLVSGKFETGRGLTGGATFQRPCAETNLKAPFTDPNISKTRHYLPIEVREQNNNLVRERIFSDAPSIELDFVISP